jgi:hypothetical protein
MGRLGVGSSLNPCIPKNDTNVTINLNRAERRRLQEEARAERRRLARKGDGVEVAEKDSHFAVSAADEDLEQVPMHMHMYICTCAYAHASIPIYMHLYTQRYAHATMHVYMYMYTYVPMHV